MVDDLRGLASLATGERPRGRKAELVALVARQLAGDGPCRLYERLGEIEQAAVAEAAHAVDGRFDAARFRAKYGRNPEWGSLGWGAKRPRRSWICCFAAAGCCRPTCAPGCERSCQCR